MFFFFKAKAGIRDLIVTGVQTCALPIPVPHARRGHGIAGPIEPFPGVMGTALDEPGRHSTMPPRKNGGNMDVKHLVAGTTLYLPVWVDGALFSVGDAHAAQGDGEGCVTAVEMVARVTLRFDLQPRRV